MLFSCNPIGQHYLGGPSYGSQTVILHKKRGVLKYLASLTHLHLHQWLIFERQLAITRYLQTFAIASLVNIRVIFIITSFKISGKEFVTKYQNISNGAPSGPVEPRSGTRFLWTWGVSIISIIEPPLLFVIPRWTILFYLYLSRVLFFLLRQGPQTSLAELGTPD